MVTTKGDFTLDELQTECRDDDTMKQPLEVFFKKGVPKNFTNFTGKHLCWSIYLHSWRLATLLNRDSNTDTFLWNLQNF